jgi:uncharacterized protein (DUF305 family)
VNKSKFPSIAAALLLLPLVSGCAGGKADKADSAPMDHSKMAGMSAPITIPDGAMYTEADVRFMQGMIAHHAQAIYMSRLANMNGASSRLKFLANKIDQSQRAEIAQMQTWLLNNSQTAPDTMSYVGMIMTGMLTPAQLKELEDLKGNEFDKKFLEYMIMHHEGAIKMVKDLFASPPSGQEVNVNVFANEVEQVQTAEIAAMHQMLADL